MILYQTWHHFWWLRHGGSALVKLNTILPGLVCAAVTALLQYTDEDFCARLNNRNTASLTAEELAQLDAAGGCDDLNYVVKWQHPYVHQAYTLCVTFLLTYRSQLAYQRFWEARTHMTAMSNRWTDAAMSLYIFDDQHDNGKNAEETQESFRGQLLHLMSLLHCFACLHLMRREEVAAGERDSPGALEVDSDADEDENGEVAGSRRSRSHTATWFFKDCRTRPSPRDRKDRRPAHQQLESLRDAKWFRVGRLCKKASNKHDRFDLGVMGDLQEGEKRALYPPWDVTSKHIENVLYRNHELPSCCHHWSEKKMHMHNANRDEKMRKVVEANMFDRVSLILGWIFRLIGQRRDAGGLWVPPPVLSRPYQNLNDGHLAFDMCKKIRDTPFPFPYAQLMRFLLVMFCLSFPFVATWAVPAQDNWPWKARILSFLVCMSLFALNEVARELEVPFHVAHNDINIEELHDQFLSMLENLHTNFSKPPELGFHNDLRNQVITPEHIFNRACNCAKCDNFDRQQQVKSAAKARMVWNTTDTATANENKNLDDLLTKSVFDFRGQDFHKLQALQLSKLQREAREEGEPTAPHSLDSELVCLQLAARVRDRIPTSWSQMQKLQFIEDIDLWLLMEAKYHMRDRWRVEATKHGGSPTGKSRMRLRGGYSVRQLNTDTSDQDWAISRVKGWQRHLNEVLQDFRQDERSVIGSKLIAKQHERDPECELMYLWNEIIKVKRGGGEYRTEQVELTLEEQDCLDHASVFMSSRLTQTEHDDQVCKTNIELYRRDEINATVVDRLYNESVIRIMKHIPDIDGRPLTADEEEKMDTLTLSVLESKESDYKEFQRLKETDLSTLSQQKKAEWHNDLKRLEVAKLNEEEQADLNRLQRQKYDRVFTGVGLKDLKRIAKVNNQDVKDVMTDEEKRDYERECEQRGESVQEAYLSLLALLPKDQLTEEQLKNYKMLRLISFYRRKDVRHKYHFNPTDVLRALPDILQRKATAELTETEREWKEYQDLQFEELHQRSTSGTGESLTEEEQQELRELSISILQRKQRDDMNLEEVEKLHVTLKAKLSEDTRDEELLEWLDMRRNQLTLVKLKEKAQAAGKTEQELLKDVQFVEQQIKFEQASIKVLERKQYEPDFSEKKQLEDLIAKQEARARAKKQQNMKQIVDDGLRLIEATKSTTDAKLFGQIEATINKMQVEDLIGMRTETEEDLLDKLYVRQLEWKLRQNAEMATTPVEDESEDEESQRARLDELARERERTTYDLERRQRSILEREKAHASRALKDAVKKADGLKDTGDTSVNDTSFGQLDGDDELAQQKERTTDTGVDLHQINDDMEVAKTRAKEHVDSQRAEVDRIDAELDQLLLKDLERRHKKGLLDSEEESQLDVQIKRCFKRKLEETGKLEPQEMQRLMDAELRLLERKAKTQTLDDHERHELDLRTFHALFTKKSSGDGLAADDDQRLDKVIVAIYKARKRFAIDKAQAALGEAGVVEGKQKVVPDEHLWSSDEDLDLKRFELKLLQQQKDAGSLSVLEIERVYNLRCEMIDGLTERIESRAELEAMQRAFANRGESSPSDQSGLPVPEPEPEPEPAGVKPGSVDSMDQFKTPRAGPSVSFSLKVDVDEPLAIQIEQQRSSNDDRTTDDGAVELSGHGTDADATDSSIGPDQQLPDLRLALTPRAEAMLARTGGTLSDEQDESRKEEVLHPLNVGQKLPSGLVMLPSSPFGDLDLASPSSSTVVTSIAQYPTDADTTSPTGLSLGRGLGLLNVGESMNMSVVGSLMLSPRMQESKFLEDGMVGQRLLSRRLSAAEEELELRSLRQSLKTELMATLTSTDKKNGRLTSEQQVRLLQLADGAEQEQEIARLIEESVEANRPKTMRGGVENAGKTLAESSRPRTDTVRTDISLDGGTARLAQTSSLKKTSSLRRAGMAALVANQLTEQARVVQSANPQRTLRRTNSDFVTPKRTTSVSSGLSAGLTRRPSNSLDERVDPPRFAEEAERENLVPVGDVGISKDRVSTSSQRTIQGGEEDEQDHGPVQLVPNQGTASSDPARP